MPGSLNAGQTIGCRPIKRIWFALFTVLTAVLAISLGFGIYAIVRS